jgi:hypothetical protein
MPATLLALVVFAALGLIATPAFAGIAEEVNVLPTLDALNRSESPLSNGGKWGALSWDTSASGHNTGQDTASGWGPYDAFSTVNGAYWTPATFNDVSGDAVSVTMNTSPGNVERYVSLWLDMPSPASAKTGYQLRWTMTNVASNTYSVTLSKWSAATQTVLASNASVTIAPGATLAISDSGATVSAWQSSGGAFSSLLSVTDSTFSGGYAGTEGSGNISRSSNFKAGLLVGPAIGATSVLDNLERNEHPFPSGSKWSKTSWAESVGGAWGSPYRGYGGSGLSGAYWNPGSFSDGGETVLSAATVGTGAPYAGEYLAVWLDMPNPGTERSGYEARFTGTNGTATAYQVELSKWVAGTRTVLSSTSGFSLPVGTTIALTETAGGTLALWSGSGVSMTPVLTAADSTYTSGYAGLEVKGGAGTLYNFRAGQVFNQPPDTSITAGPKGNVLPNVAVSFSSNKTGTSFECSLDGVAYGTCTSPKSYSSLSEGAHVFKVRAVGSGGKDETPAERSFQTIAPAKAMSKVAVLDNLERSEIPLANGKWSKTNWTNGIGGAWLEGYRGFGSNGGLEGAYWNPATFSDGGESQLIAATVGTGATPAGQYLGLWLDMPNPGSERTGYEARFTGTNGTATAYQVELSKWVAGTRTVLSSTTGFSLSAGTTIALSETAGGTLALWSGTSTSMSQVLSSTDTAYTSGYAGLEVNGGAGTLYNFKAGKMDLTAPNTTISSGPSGVVQPENVSFTFTATEGATSFECSLDGAAYSACASPKAYPGLASGSSHTFKVRALDAVGNQDETPAERSFQVVALPSAITTAATAVKSTEATLHASINPNGAETKYQFEYGTTTSYGSKAPATAVVIGSGTASVEASQPIAGLALSTTYHFRISATNAVGTSRGEDRTFTTPAAPLATTEAATSVTNKGATLNATVNPKGAETTYQFEYGTTTSYGSSIPGAPKAIGAGTSVLSVSESTASLQEGTTYHYRVVAVNEAGTTYGADQIYSTTQLPLATTEAAAHIEGIRATLRGVVNPHGRETSYRFEYGTSTAYGSVEPQPSESVGRGSEVVAASEIIEALQPSTIYHYRLVATSDAGTSFGADQTFTTGSTSANEEGQEESWIGGKETGTSEGAFTSSVGSGVKIGKGEVVPPFVNVMFGTGQEVKQMVSIARLGAGMLRRQFTKADPVASPTCAPKSSCLAPVYGELFQVAATHHVEIMPTLYAGGSGGAHFPTLTSGEWTQWKAFTKEMVEEFGPHGRYWANNGEQRDAPVTYWEVWNEPNRGFNNPDGQHVNASAYGEFLASQSQAISEGSSGDARTIVGGLLSIGNSEETAKENGTEVTRHNRKPDQFIEEMGHTSSYTAVGVHPYAFAGKSGKAPTNGTEIDEVTTKIKKHIQEIHDVTSKPLWITELGWPVDFHDPNHPGFECNGAHNCEKLRGEMLIDAFDMIKENSENLNIRTVFYYNFRDPNLNPGETDEWDKHCGLIGRNGHFREAAYAFEAEAGLPHRWPVKPPTHTKPVSSPHSRRAIVSGTVNPEGLPTFFRVEYGTEAKHLSALSPNVGEAEPEAGYDGEVEVQRELTGLSPNTTYYYRVVATNENGESEVGEEQHFETEPSTRTFATVISHNGRPGWVTVEGHVFGEGPLNGDYVNINFKKKENGEFVFNEQQSTHANIENNYYKLDKKSIGEGVWKVVVVFPGFGEDLRSEAPGEHEFTIQAIPTETFLTLDKYSNGTPGTASVSGNVQHNGVGISGTVNVNFQKLVGGSWQTMSTAQRVLSNGHYEVLNWGVGVGQWRVRAVFPNQDEYAESESAYHEFSIQPVPTETFLTVDGTANGTPGTASVSGNVQHNGVGVSGTVNVNFEKWNGSAWQTISTAQRTLSNGHYEVSGWGVGVGQWRVRAVFPEQGDYGQSESNYHEFSIQPVPTEAFLTVDQVVKGKPGNVSVSGNVLHNGAGVSGYVNVNFEKWNGSSWQTMSTAQPGLSNGHYVVSNWGVGAGSWRVRAVFPEQGEYAGSMSGYHEFTI